MRIIAREKNNSTQQLIGARAFSRFGLRTDKGELVFFIAQPTNISVLSQASIENRVRRFSTLLTAYPDLTVCCLDASERFDDNKEYLRRRMGEETNPKVRALLERDLQFLDDRELEMSAARHFLFILRLREESEEQNFSGLNRMEKVFREQGFETHRASKEELKQLLTLYFEGNPNGAEMEDDEGERWRQ